MHWHRIILVSPLVNPAGDKGILANPVTLEKMLHYDYEEWVQRYL